MSEENSWIDFSNATPWEESISNLEDIFSNFHIGIQTTEIENEIGHKDAEFVFDGLHYIVSYYYSSYSCQWKENQVNWPVYMVEMMDVSSRHERQGSVVYDTFDISEFIYIHLESSELRSYIDLNRSKQLLSSALLAMRSQEYSIPVFVECNPNRIPFIGYALSHFGENGYLTSFKSEFFRDCPKFCENIPSLIVWFTSQTLAESESIVVSRSYHWIWFPSTQSKWRYHLLEKEEVRTTQPVLYMLQGFSSVTMWGPIHNPLTGITITADMAPIPYKEFDAFNPMKANRFQIEARFSDSEKLPLTTMFHSLHSCWKEALKAGPLFVLYTTGQRLYNQLLTEEERSAKGGSFVITSMMDFITGNRAVSVEAIVDAVKYVFKKGIQVNNEECVEDIYRHDFVPQAYLDHVVSDVKVDDDEATPIFLPERVIRIPHNGIEEKWLLPEVNGSYHIPRHVPSKDAYAWVSHSAPPSSLVTLMSLRCSEIVNDKPLETLSLFWYLCVTVIETHYEHHKLLPHMGCISDPFDNISTARPPLPTFQYNLLHQKLTLLNCCIEEQLNNTSNEDLFTTDSDSPLYYSDEEKEVEEESFHKPKGKGILNWSGWFLTGTSIPCWIPITKDKTILTEDKVKQQQELLAKAGSAVNEIRDEFIDTVADDIQAFKAANPKAQFEDFVRWHSPRDWSEKEGEVMGELSSRMQGNNPLRNLFDELEGLPAKQQKQFFNPDFEAELVLDYLRTLSPLTAMQNLLSPFLEATAYILDHVDESILRVERYQLLLQEYKSVIKQVSYAIDSTGDVSSDLLEMCESQLMEVERLVARVSSLLETTKGDWEVVNELTKGFIRDEAVGHSFQSASEGIDGDFSQDTPKQAVGNSSQIPPKLLGNSSQIPPKSHGNSSQISPHTHENSFQLNLIDSLHSHRKPFVELIQPQLDKGEADASVFKLYATSCRSSEDDAIAERVESSGHRLCIVKNDNGVVVSSSISSCDIMH